MEIDDEDIDEDLHRRQMLVYGRKAMKLLVASNVLVSGMQGLGAEIAKNLILTGIKSVTLHDERAVEWSDLAGSFVLSESDVHKKRAEASVRKLQELNNRVRVTTLSGKLTKEQLSDFQAVVFTATDLHTVIVFNDYCHNHQPPIPFINADVNGLFGNVFCDFGPEFTVADVDGEEPHIGIIANITIYERHGVLVVYCVSDEKLQFQDGDFVVLSEIHGMIELNDGKPRKIKICSPYSFFLEEEDTAKLGKYEKGGIVTQVKQPKVLNFRPMRQVLADPKELLRIDSSKPDHPPVLHLAFKALDSFMSKMGRFPTAGSEDDAHKLISIATRFNNRRRGSKCKVEDIKPELLMDFSHGARAVLCPMATMFGGIAAQEVIKACSRMFHPIFQLLYFDSVEILSTGPLKPKYRVPSISRYNAQMTVLGYKFQERLGETETLIVGCGSLGCELLKNLALMGVSCNIDHYSSRRRLTVVDNDIIKKNNQGTGIFSHKNHIGMSKAVTAASEAACINPEFLITPLLKHVGPETQNVFDIAFWKKVDVVISAVDDVDSKIYVDRRCVRFNLPHLVSGTMGAKCSTQMVIPGDTENYGASMDTLEKEVGETTLKYFPYNIHHCVRWAMRVFEELLETPLHDVNAYLEDPYTYESTIRVHSGDSKTVEVILNWLDMERCETFQDCIKWACRKFEDYFTDRVKKMVVEYPQDLTTSFGTPFWSPPKRFPHPIVFTLSDPSHVCFVLAASILCAEIFHIPVLDWAKDFEKMEQAVENITNIIHDLKPNQGDTGSTSINTPPSSSSSMAELFKKLEQCRKSLPTGFRMKPIQFDKDDSSNYHIDLIAGLANMRARNYNIPEVDKLTIKAIARRNLKIPKIPTCTSMAAGLVCLELYKFVEGNFLSREVYRNTFVNLALPFFSMAQPLPPKVYNEHHQNTRLMWRTWDSWNVENKPTLGDIITCLEEKKGVHVYQVSYEDYMVYNTTLPNHEYLRTLNVMDLLMEYAKPVFHPEGKFLVLAVACLDDGQNPIDAPPLVINLRTQYIKVEGGNYLCIKDGLFDVD